MSQHRPDFPLVWDNSMRSSFISCPRKFAWEYLDHWKPRSTSTDLHAGKAFASALESARRAYYIDKLPALAAEARGFLTLTTEYGSFEPPPNKQNKSLPRMLDAYSYYFHHFPLASDPCQPYVGPNGPMIEFGAVLPLSSDLRHPVTGEPLLYSMRADMLATYAGALTIYDDKTTSSLGPSWASSWDMRAQFTGYAWAAREYGLPVTQILVRGVAILKTKLDHAQAISDRNQYRVDRWHGQIQRDIRRALAMWEEGYWDYNEADTCSSYSGCIFRQPCMSSNPEPWLASSFARRKWDPVTREEILLPTPTQTPNP